eukprot:XP_001697640.1 predicted protein [Chlamydomonas reinhardtii]
MRKAPGDPASIGCGDYYAAKGVGYARVSAPSGPLDVFNTHLHANYHHTYDKPAGPHDILELARYVNTTSRASGAAGVVLGGDLNSKPGTLEQEVLRALLPQLRDSWSETHAPGEAGYTCKAPGNTFPPRRQPPERIDYVLTTLGVAACDIKLEAIGFCFFAQLMALLGKSLHPHATFAPPLAAIVCAAGAAIFFVMAINLRLLNAETAAALRERYNIIRLDRCNAIPSRGVAIACAETWPGDAFARHWGCPEPWRSLPLPRRLRLLCLAASSHHPPSLDAALTHSGVRLSFEVLQAAAAAGDLNAFLRLLSEGCDCAMAALEAAAHCGHLHLLQWVWCSIQISTGSEPGRSRPAAVPDAFALPVPWPRRVVGLTRYAFLDMAAAAAANGHVGILERLLQPGGPYGEYNTRTSRRDHEGCTPAVYASVLLPKVAFGCPHAALERLFRAWVPASLLGAPEESLFRHALLGTSPDWERNCDFALEMTAAGEAALLSVRLHYLHARGVRVGEVETAFAEALAAAGDVAALAQLLDGWGVSGPRDARLLSAAARAAAGGGHVPVLALLAERFGPRVFVEHCLMAAADGGHSGALRFLIAAWMGKGKGLQAEEMPLKTDDDFKLSPELIEDIAGRLHRNEVVTNLKLLNSKAAAALRGSYSTIRLEHRKPVPYRNVYIACAETWPGDAFARHWGRPEPWRSLPFPRRLRLLCLAASSHHPPSLGAALTHSGVGLAPAVIEAAAAAGDLDAFLRLVSEGCDCAMAALEAAAHCGQLHVLQWVWEELEPGLQLRQAFDCGLLDRLLQPDGRYADAFEGLANYMVKELFLHIGSFCPLATLQRYHATWAPHVSEEEMVVVALQGTTADWREKCDCMLEKLAAALEEERAAAEAMGQQAGGGVLEGPEAQEGPAALVVRVARSYMRGWGQFAEHWPSKNVPDFMERMRYLTALGLPSGEWEPQVATALAATGNAVTLRQLLDMWNPAAAGRREHSEWQRKYGYHVPVLELLVERFGAGVFGLEDIIAAGESYRMPALQYLVNTWVQAHAAGQQDSSGSKIAAGSGGARGWGKALSCAAEQGADLSLLRLLHERCGAAIDLAAVATGGSEDSIQWAVGTLRAARRDASLTADQVWRIAEFGNLAAAAWVLDHGLLSPRGRALPHPADCPCISAFKPAGDYECWTIGDRGPVNCIRLWVARRAMAAAAAPAGSRAHQAKEWVRLEALVANGMPHQKAWLRRQRPQELQQAVAAMPLKTDDDFKLSPELIEDIAGRLHPNEVVTNLKLLNSKAAAALRGSYSTIRLEHRKPLPYRSVYIACAETWPGDAFARHWGCPEPWRSLPFPRRLRLLCLAASSHHPPSLDAALTHSGVGLAPTVIEAAAAAGDLDAFLRLVSEGCNCAMAALEAAAHCGHLHILQCAWYYSLEGIRLRQAFGCGPEEVRQLAVSACAGGQGHVLTWLESLADPPAQPPPTAAAVGAAGAAATGSKHNSNRGGLDHVRVCESLESSFFAMAIEAAVHGRTGLLDRLLQQHPSGRYTDAFEGLANYMVKELLLCIASFCPVATLQHYHAAWVPKVIRVAEEELTIAALRGTTADWREKCDYMLKKLAAALEEERAAEPDGGAVPDAPTLAARRALQDMKNYYHFAEYWPSKNVPDFMERMRYLTALGLPSGEWEPQREISELLGQAVSWGHVPVLELLVERFGAGAFGIEDIMAAGESNRMPALQYLVNTWDASLTADQVWRMAGVGNLAAAAWVLDHGLLSPRGRALPHPADCPCISAFEPDDECGDSEPRPSYCIWLWVERRAMAAAAAPAGGESSAMRLAEQWVRLEEFMEKLLTAYLSSNFAMYAGHTNYRAHLLPNVYNAGAHAELAATRSTSCA